MILMCAPGVSGAGVPHLSDGDEPLLLQGGQQAPRPPLRGDRQGYCQELRHHRLTPHHGEMPSVSFPDLDF